MVAFQYLENLWVLLAIPLLVLFYFLVLQWKRKSIKKIGDKELVKQLLKGYSPQLFALKFVLIVIAFALCSFAAANLREKVGSEKITQKGIDVMIALDVSKSMLAEDIKPSRLERAKQMVSKLIDKLNGDRIGIVIFAGRAYLQMPMTTDLAAAKMYLSSASPDDIPTQGTVINEALDMCSRSFNTKEKKYRAIILISDGEDHDENALKTTKQLSDDGIMINTIGVGSPEGAQIVDKESGGFKKDENGNTVITKLNEEELKGIATAGKGLYQLLNNVDDVASNMQQQLETIGQTNLTDSSTASYKNYFWYFLAVAFLLLILETVVPEKRKMVNNSKKVNKVKVEKAILALVIFLCISSSTFAQEINKQIIKGNDAYKNGKLDDAEKTYTDVLTNAPDNTVASYNLANTLYKKNKTDDAVKAFDNTIHLSTDKSIREKAFYNKGVTYQASKKLPECIEAYKNALKLDPLDEEARQNLQRALQQMKDQQKKDPKDKKDKQKQNQDQKKQQQKQDQKNQQPQQPKPQPSKLSKQDAEEKLKSLLQHENNLQDKLHKVQAAVPDKPKKDW